MAKFLDGPAFGHDLLLRQCPTMLRVTIREAGLPGIGELVVDALDQPGDELEEGERIEVYRVVPGTWSVAFVDSRQRGGPQGRYEFADYRHVPVDPHFLRQFADVEEWRAWVETLLVCTCGHLLSDHPSDDRTGGPCGRCGCQKFELGELSDAG